MAQAISSLIFSTRRTNSGFEAADDRSPAVALMNWDIACGQIFKAAKETIEASKEVKTELANKIISAEEAIKNMSKGDKALQGIGKVAQFTADHVNSLICLTGGFKVAYSDDKLSALIQEASALATMFTFEAAAKEFLGLSKNIKVDGVSIKVKQEAKLSKILRKSEFVNKGIESAKKYILNCKNGEKILQYAPSIAKGLCFATASIVGYKLGSNFGQKTVEYIKDKKNNKSELNNAQLTDNAVNTNEYKMLSLTSKNV